LVCAFDIATAFAVTTKFAALFGFENVAALSVSLEIDIGGHLRPANC
jgi:hypothetical protein